MIIEILSPSTAYYDPVEKKEIYETVSVKEYWIVDPKKYWIEIFVVQDKKYKSFQKKEIDGKIQSHLLQGLEIDLSEMFA